MATRAIVNIYGKDKTFICCGDCMRYPIKETDCELPQDTVQYFYGGLKYMIKAGWGLVKNDYTGHVAGYMCPECFPNYKNCPW